MPNYPDTCLAVLFLCAASPAAALAQITPDNTLGNETSVVTPDALVQGDLAELIEGGAIRDTNLFHSFSDFNVETLQRVYFANPAGIDTILTRVTGGNGSSIDGTLGVDGLADLYLLNPNGIAFGPNAQLDIRGSFVASTADSWNLGDGLVFSAVDPEAPPLLAVTLTPGLQYGAAQQADITNDGNLAVAPEASLVLMGDTVTHTGTLTAPGGDVQLLGNRVGVFGSGQIEVSSPTGGGRVNLGGGFQGQGPLPTAQQTVVGPNAELIADAMASGDGGEIIVWSDDLTRFYGSASARGGAIAGDGGLVEVSGLEQLVYDGQVDTTAANGAIGTLLLDPTNIIVVESLAAETSLLEDVDEFSDPDINNDEDTQIEALAIALANSDVVLQATDTISFESPVVMLFPSIDLTATAGDSITVNQPVITSGGDILLEAPNIAISEFMASSGGGITLLGEDEISIDNNAIVESADVSGVNDAGDILVQTSGPLSLIDGAQIRASVLDTGNGGNVDVRADSVFLDGFRINFLGLFNPSTIGSEIRTDASGSGGEVTVDANTISVTNGASISTSNQGEGDSGNLSVTADQIVLDGIASVLGFPLGTSGISSQANETGSGGDVTVRATDISITNGAVLSTPSRGGGDAGNLSIVADQIEVDGTAPGIATILGLGPSIVGSQVLASGDGGNVEIDARNISVTNGAVISNSVNGTGNAGSLSVTAEQLEVNGFASNGATGFGASSVGSQASMSASGNGGDVFIEADSILVTNGASISNSNAGAGNAGSLSVTTDRIALDGFAAIEETTVSPTGVFSEVGTSGDGGDVAIEANTVSVTNGALISNSNSGSGDAGSLSVTANRLELDGFASIGETTLASSGIGSQVFASGPGGAVDVNADFVSITSGASISTSNAGQGTAGSLSVTADQIELDGFASVEGNTVGFSSIGSQILDSGDGGAIDVNADSISITNGANISTSNAGTGTAGSLTISASQIELDGFASGNNTDVGFSGIGSEVREDSSGAGGDVLVEVDNIFVTNGAIVSTSNIGAGTAGDLSIVADQIELEGSVPGEGSFLGFSGITSEVQASGSGGNISVEANAISIMQGAGISTTTLGITNAGSIEIQVADSIELNDGGIASSSLASANSGDISLTAEGDVILRDESFISAGTFAPEGTLNASTAAAGEINVAGDRIFLNRSAILTTSNLGDGGNLFVEANDFLLLRNASQISTTAGLLTSGGDGGNIIVDAPFVVGVLTENSDITANAFLGNGGTVTVTALDIIGLEFQDDLTPFSDITASSEVGNAGITEFNRLTDVNPEDSLDEIPIDLTDPASLIDRQCALQATPTASEFTVVGRGGLPIDPSQPSIADTFLEDLGTVPEPTDTANELSRADTPDEDAAPLIQQSDPTNVIREAQGWIQDEYGRMHLVSTASQNPLIMSLIDDDCPRSPTE